MTEDELKSALLLMGFYPDSPDPRIPWHSHPAMSRAAGVRPAQDGRVLLGQRFQDFLFRKLGGDPIRRTGTLEISFKRFAILWERYLENTNEQV